jgi:hypothetical protein
VPYFPRQPPADPNALPRVEYRDYGLTGAYVFVDYRGGVWGIFDLAGGHGWPIERCSLGRTSRWTQYRVFVLLPNALYARLYHFGRGEGRGLHLFDIGRLAGYWERAVPVDLPIAPAHLRDSA